MQFTETELRLRKLVADKATIMGTQLGLAHVTTMTADDFFKLAYDFRVQSEELMIMAKQFEQEALLHYGRSNPND